MFYPVHDWLEPLQVIAHQLWRTCRVFNHLLAINRVKADLLFRSDTWHQFEYVYRILEYLKIFNQQLCSVSADSHRFCNFTCCFQFLEQFCSVSNFDVFASILTQTMVRTGHRSTKLIRNRERTNWAKSIICDHSISKTTTVQFLEQFVRISNIYRGKPYYTRSYSLVKYLFLPKTQMVQS